jgi:hypothetical protein
VAFISETDRFMPIPLADSIDDLTQEWFTTVLRSARKLPVGTTVIAVDTQLVGTGQAGLIVRAELDYDGPSESAPSSLIVKLPSPDPGSRALGTAIGAYEGEVRFYEELAAASGVRVPAYLGGGFEAATGRVTVVLEDLTGSWAVGDAVAGGTVQQAGAAFEQLARVHAAHWGATGDSVEWIRDPGRTQVLFTGVPAAVPGFLSRFEARIDPETLSLASQLGPGAADYPGSWSEPLVVSHGDFRLDNVLFRDGGTGLEATVIDWQSVRMAPPGVDLAMWLGSCLSPSERRVHTDELLHRYHAGLVAAGVNDFGLDDIRRSLRVGALYPFLLGVGASMMLQQSERGDAMFAAMVTLSGALVADLGSAEVAR